MSNRKRIGLYIIGLIVVAYFMPVTKNWAPSYSKNHNWPYGADVTRDVWTDLFSDVSITDADLPIWNTLRENDNTNDQLYVLFDGSMRFDSLNRSSILDFVHEGNSAFISSYNIDSRLLDTLGLDTEDYYGEVETILDGLDSLTIDFFEARDSSYNFFTKSYESYFVRIDSVKSDVVALAHGIEKYHLTYIKVAFGDGHFYLHNQPLLLTNYYVLEDEGKRYLERLTSYLPSHDVIWDNSHKAINAMTKQSPLHVVLSQTALRWAYWLTILGLVLLFVFRTKRRQRIIPEVEPPANDSVAFTKTMGSLYYNTASNKTLALKKISVLKEYMSRQFYLRDITFNDEEIATIVNKTDINKDEVMRLFKMINNVQLSQGISAGQLKVLNKGVNRLMGKRDDLPLRK